MTLNNVKSCNYKCQNSKYDVRKNYEWQSEMSKIKSCTWKCQESEFDVIKTK